jgi:nucleoside phosphorylase
MPAKPNQLDFFIGWICIIEREFHAALEVLEEDYGTNGELGFIQGEGDGNQYELGRIGNHKVVINCPQSGAKGHSAAIKIASAMTKTFPSLRFVLLVGIGGGAPEKEDIRLGDVVIGNQVVSYRTGKFSESGFEVNGDIQRPPDELLTAVTRLRSGGLLSRKVSMKDAIEAAFSALDKHGQRKYARPQHDLLFQPNVLHKNNLCGCLSPESVNANHLISRDPRDPDALVQVHAGTIGCADQVIKNAAERDQLARQQGIVCFEMEATAVMPTVPCLPIRGISDYADGHKNDAWHDYAALAAAVCAKTLLKIVKESSVSNSKPSIDTEDLEDAVKPVIQSILADIDEALQQDGAQEKIKDRMDTLAQHYQLYQDHLVKLEVKKGVSAADLYNVEQQLRALASSIGLICVKVDHRANEAAQAAPGTSVQQKWESLRRRVNKKAQEINRRTAAHNLLHKILGVKNKVESQIDRDLSEVCLELVLGSSRQLSNITTQKFLENLWPNRNLGAGIAHVVSDSNTTTQNNSVQGYLGKLLPNRELRAERAAHGGSLDATAQLQPTPKLEQSTTGGTILSRPSFRPSTESSQSTVSLPILPTHSTEPPKPPSTEPPKPPSTEPPKPPSTEPPKPPSISHLRASPDATSPKPDPLASVSNQERPNLRPVVPAKRSDFSIKSPAVSPKPSDLFSNSYQRRAVSPQPERGTPTESSESVGRSVKDRAAIFENLG